MLDWNEYRKQLAVGVKAIGELSRDTVKGYLGLSSAGEKADLLGAKIRELIARERQGAASQISDRRLRTLR